MSDWFKESDCSSSRQTSERNAYRAIAQDGWNGHQTRCGKSAETASEHLPGLSIGEDKDGYSFNDFLSRNDRRFRDHDNFSKWRDEGSRECGSDKRRSDHAPADRGPHHHHGGRSHWDKSSESKGCSSGQDDQGNSGSEIGDITIPSDGGTKNPRDGGKGNPADGNTNPIDAGTPTDGGTDPIPNTTISEMTRLSEQLLPVHANGSYPSVSDWENLHSQIVQRAQNAAQNGSDLEFFGDSITEAMGYDPAAMQPFKNNFGADNPTALGLGGDGTQQLLYRLNHGEMQGTPKAVVINIGTNDIGSLSSQQIADNVQKSIESIQLRSPDTKIVLMGILPRTEAGDPGNAKVDAANAALSRLATGDSAVQFVDLKSSFLDANGNQRAELYKPDKLHLSSAGYQAWADGIKNALNRISTMPVRLSVPGSGSGSGDSGTENSGSGSSGSGDSGSGNWGRNSGPGDSGNWGGNNSGSDSGDSGAGDFGSDIGNVGSPLTTLDTANIRGVNLSGAEWGKNSSTDTQFWPTEEELDYYKSKGMNTVRLMLSWEQLQPKLGGPLDTAEMNRLKDFLKEADERGMKVLVTGGSFARYTLNHGAFGAGADGEVNGTKVGDSGVPVSAMADFWTKMVNEINSDPAASRGVGGWDLTNEPHTMGGTWPAIATAVDRAIRATGDQHTIVVEGDQWARDFSGLEQLAREDKNVAFEAHSYWDDGSGGYANRNFNGNANVGVDHIRSFVSWLKQNDARGFVGEWGVPTDNTGWAPAVTNFIDYLDMNGIGNIVWAGGPGWQPNYTLSVEPINGQDRPIMETIVDANET